MFSIGACRECLDCGWMCNEIICPKCGSSRMSWDEEITNGQEEDQEEEEEEEEEED